MNNKVFSSVLVFGLVIGLLGMMGPRSAAAPESNVALTAPGPQVVVLLDNRYIPHHVPPPARPEWAAQSATFVVNWNPSSCSGSISPWSNEAKTAFSYAVNIWAGLLNSSQTIVVDACWRSDLGSGVLGAAGTTTIHRDFPGAPVTGTWYPAALANALTNSDLNGSTAEINANFSSTFNWYYGTDGNTPSDKIDFVSVVLHELGHGLGFYGMGNVTLGLGTVRYSGYPGIYDQFTEDGDGTPLLSYTNHSVALGNALTGKVGGVYFNGTHANEGNEGARVKLYSPSPWQEGSSYSHLDEIFNGTPNALMTYSLGYGESEHSPGPVMLGMFEDMGWTLASPSPAPTVTSITPNSGVRGNTVSVTIAGSNFQSGATVKLTKSGESDISGTSVNVVNASQITCDLPLAGAAAGQWNVVVTNPDSQSGTLPNGFTVSEPPPTVTSISPDNGDRGSAVSVTITGSDFQSGATVKLTKSGATDIAGTAVNVVNATQITCDFLLVGAETGQWNVVVTNPDSQSGTLPNGFTVNEPPAPDVTLSQRLIGRDFQPGDPITFVLSIANVGDMTAVQPVVVDHLPDEVITETYASDLNVSPIGSFSFTWNVEQLSAGESGVITIYGWIAPTATFPFVNIATIADAGDHTPDNNTGLAIVGGYELYLPLAMREG